MHGDAHRARLDERAGFANAVAYGQITPGPVTHTVALVGYAAAGPGGALLATAIAFAPSFAFVLLGGGALRAPARRAPTRARFLDGAGPAAAGAILGAAVPLAGRARGRLAVGVARRSPRSRSRSAARRSRAARRAVLGLLGHYALPIALADELQDETAEVSGHADPVQHRQPAGRRARVPGVARDYLADAGLEVELDGAEPRAAEPRRDADSGEEPGPVLGYLSHVDTVLADAEDWSTTRGAARCATASCTAAARST